MSENNNNELGRKLGLGAVIALGVYGYCFNFCHSLIRMIRILYYGSATKERINLLYNICIKKERQREWLQSIIYLPRRFCYASNRYCNDMHLNLG